MTLLSDCREAMRTMRRRPSPAVGAVLTLALGIGSATAIFSLADAVLLRALPYADAHRIVTIWQSDRQRNQPFVEISYPAFREWRDRTHTLQAVAGMPSVNFEMALTGRGEPKAVEARAVTGNFFPLFGTAPAIGRTLGPADEQSGAAAVAVLSEGLWRELFDATTSALGQAVILDGRPHTVVGVMPAAFQFPKGARLWLPLQPSSDGLLDNAGVMWMIGLGRLKQGVEIEAAASEMTGLWRQMHSRLAPAGTDVRMLDAHSALVTPLPTVIFGDTRPAILAMLGAGILVLLVACANVAGLRLIQATDRRRDIAVRQALGATRLRLVRAAFAESLLVAMLAAAVGLAAAHLAIPLILAVTPPDIPRLDEASLNGRAFAFALVSAIMAALLSTLAPLLLSSPVALDDMLRHASPRVAVSARGVRGVLVAGEVALALVLLIGAGLLIRSFMNLRQAPVGFNPAPVLTVTLSLTGERYATVGRVRELYREVLERVRALPGVASAAAITRRPLWSTVGYDWIFTLEGQSQAEAARNPMVNLMAITTDYFPTMGIPVTRGRTFTAADAEGQPGVLVVSESLAARTWPGVDPIGKRMRMPMGGTPYHDVWLTVIGVVGDARYREIQATRLDLYMSFLQLEHPLSSLMVRAHGNPASLAKPVADIVRQVDPQLPVRDMTTMNNVVSDSLAVHRFAARVVGVFAAVALALSALGVYLLLAYSVMSRAREIGIRMALGARPADVQRLVFQQGAVLTVAGLAFGLATAAASARLLNALLYDVRVWDPVTFTLAPLVLAGTALVACWVPAVRATRVDPARVLRAE